jgi:hypothetical protein
VHSTFTTQSQDSEKFSDSRRDILKKEKYFKSTEAYQKDVLIKTSLSKMALQDVVTREYTINMHKRVCTH